MIERPNSQDVSEADREAAREYVLGTLSREARAAFVEKLAQNTTLQAQVTRWQEQFSALGMDVDTGASRATVFEHLKRELWSENSLPWQRRIRIWEYALGGIAAACVAFAVFRFGDVAEQVPPILQAQITLQEQDLRFALALHRDKGLLQIERSGSAAAQGMVYVLWGFDATDKPVFMGVLPRDLLAVIRIQDPVLAMLLAQKPIAISSERASDAPYEAVLGPLVGKARFSAVDAQ